MKEYPASQPPHDPIDADADRAREEAAYLIDQAAALLSHEDPGVREQAAVRLRDLGTTEAAARIAPLIASPDIQLRNLAGEVLVRMGTAAVTALTPFLGDPSADVRKFAIDLLAQLPAAATAPQIATSLTDADHNVRISAIDALGALNAAEYADDLVGLFDKDPLARPSIVTALGRIGRREDLDLLETALAQENTVLQFAAAEALTAHHRPELFHRLVRQLDRVHEMARPILVSSLIDLIDYFPQHDFPLPEALLPYLLDMLDDCDASFQWAAVHGLRRFPGRDTTRALLRRAGRDQDLDFTIYETLLHEPDVLEPILEATTEGSLDASTACTFLIGFLAEQHLAEDAYSLAGEFLARHFADQETETKHAVLAVCQRLGHAAFHPVLYTGASDPNPAVHAAALEAAHATGLPPLFNVETSEGPAHH